MAAMTPPRSSHRAARLLAWAAVAALAAVACALLAAAAGGLLAGRVLLLVALLVACVVLGGAGALLLLRLRTPAEPAPPAAAGGPGRVAEVTAMVEHLRDRLQQATITSNHLDDVLNSLTDAVLVTNRDGCITRVNAAALQLFGAPEADLVGRDVATLISPDERRDFVLARAARETREYLIRTPSGESVPVSMSGSMILDSAPGTAPAAGAPPEAGAGFIFVAHDITARRRAERRVRYLARYDALTKIPNRMQFQHLLQQAIARARRNGTAVALLYLDLDRFKDVNDTFGHEAGDRTLEILSERLTRLAPKGALVGRLAGDEFALFIENLPADDCRPTLAAVGRQLLDDVSRGFFLNDTEVYLTLSIGIGLYPEDAANTLDLIRNADAAMYHAKQSGGGSVSFYAPEMNAPAVERLILKSKLRRSLERDEFVILYQPKVEIDSGRIAGAEALLRWRLPGHGDIPPAHFIPLAEQTNLILPIGEWVLRRVCMDYSSWRAQVPAPGRVSINLSLRQLQQASFITRFASVFQEYQVAPDCLELEITETTLMSNAPRTVQLLRELHDLGIRLSIDDFGTGYSSLSALQQMPVQTLKIDQSFVRNAALGRDDATLVRTIIEMGHNLNLEVVAEGVETREQLEFLRERGCHYAQGRLFGEPMSSLAFLGLLEAQQRGENPLPAVERRRAPRARY